MRRIGRSGRRGLGRPSARRHGICNVQIGRRVRDTIGRCGNPRLIWHGGDCSECFRWLLVCLNSSGSVGVYAGIILVIAITSEEGVVGCGVGGVVCAADTVVDVLTELGCVWSCRIASFEAEYVTPHEAVATVSWGSKRQHEYVLCPFNDLLESAVVVAPCSGVYKATQGVTAEILGKEY